MDDLVQLKSFGVTEGEVLGALGRVKVRDVVHSQLWKYAANLGYEVRHMLSKM
mgnify:CR=1 FL=1